MLVSVTIIALLLTTIYGVFSSVSGAKRRLETQGEGYHQARVIFDRIGREVRGTYYTPRNPDTMFAGGENADRNPFLDLTTTATTPQGGRGTGISVVRYELIDDPEAKDESKVLMRKEYPLFDPEGAERDGYRLARGIEELKFRFYANADWQDDWQPPQTGLPLMVEVTLNLNVENQSIPFQSTFEVPRIQVQ